VREISDRLLYDFYGGLLNGRAAEIMSMRLNEDLSLSEIADAVNITKQGAKNYIDRSLRKIREIEAKTGAHAKYRRAADFLRECAQELSEGADAQKAAEKIDGFLKEY